MELSLEHSQGTRIGVQPVRVTLLSKSLWLHLGLENPLPCPTLGPHVSNRPVWWRCAGGIVATVGFPLLPLR